MIVLLSTILVISVIVFVHELGHFAMSKFGGVRVEKFSLGFPPSILKKRLGETVYSIGAIPFGGYVKLAGEDAERADKPPMPYELSAKPRWIRALIMLSGPLMNFVLAVFLFWAVIAFHGTGTMSERAVIGGVIEGAPADSAGLEPLDSIISVSGAEIASWSELAQFVHERAGIPLDFIIQRGDSALTMSITPIAQSVKTESGNEEVGLIGIQPVVDFVPSGVFRAVPQAFSLLWEVLGSMMSFFKKIISSGVEKGDIGGPILIARMAGASAKSGWASFFFFLAALSVNLGILNLLPLPALDGGQLVIIGIEAVIRKPLSFKVRAVVQQIGFLFIIALMIYITLSDLSMLFGK